MIKATSSPLQYYKQADPKQKSNFYASKNDMTQKILEHRIF